MPERHIALLLERVMIVLRRHPSYRTFRLKPNAPRPDLPSSFLFPSDALEPGNRGRPLVNRGPFLRLASIPGSVASPHRRQRHPLTVPARTTSPIHITPSVLRNANNASYPLGSSVLIAAGPAQRFNSGSPIYGKASFAACVADGDGQARPTDYLECWLPKWLYPT